MTRLDIEDVRRRCAGAIKNTPTGKWLGLALDELDFMRDRYEPEQLPLFGKADDDAPAMLQMRQILRERRLS
jgi:hypothetical protein